VLCTSDGDLVSRQPRSESHRPKRLLVLSIGKLDSGDNLRFKDEPNTPNRDKVNVLQTSVTYMFRLHPTVDVGFGAGTLRFSGNDFKSLWRFTLVPSSISVRPLALVNAWKYKWWSYVVRGEVETSFVTKGYNARDFGNSTSTFSSGPEFLTRAAIVIDFTPAVWR
jgi:hypothetical protein